MNKIALVGLVASFWTACGGDGGGGTAQPANSGVASDTKVTALTDDDAKKFCRWLDKLDSSLNVTDEQDCTLDAWDELTRQRNALACATRASPTRSRS